MSLIVPVNPLLPPLTKDQTHKKLEQNKNSLLLFYLPLLCCTFVLFPSIQPTKIAKYFHIASTKNSISILFYYFINISYSSLAFDQL